MLYEYIRYGLSIMSQLYLGSSRNLMHIINGISRCAEGLLLFGRYILMKNAYSILLLLANFTLTASFKMFIENYH